MEDSRLQKKKKKIRVAREEFANREGHWVREFTARSDMWPIVEHWAHENGYHLSAMRGPRRLYSKGDNDATFSTLVDIKQTDRRVVLSAWVHAGWLARLRNLFFIGGELQLEMDGFWGVKARRAAARDLNVLLLRVNQPIIMGSDNFHVMDLHSATLGLFTAIVASFVAFLFFALQSLEFRTGLTHRLFEIAGKSAGVLAGTAVFAIVAHGVLSRKYLPNDWAKIGSAAAFALVVAVVGIILGTRTGSDVREERVAHHCVTKADPDQCQHALQLLNPSERAAFWARVDNLQKGLGYKPGPHQPTK